MIIWIKNHASHAIAGAFLGAMIVGCTQLLEVGPQAGLIGTIQGGLVGAIFSLIIEALRSYDQTRERNVSMKRPLPPLMEPLSVGNPFHQARFLSWLFLQPYHLEAYRKQAGEAHVREMVAWLASSLLWLPLLIAGLVGILNKNIVLAPLRSTQTILMFLVWISFLLIAFFVTGMLGTPQKYEPDHQDWGFLFILAGILFILAIFVGMVVVEAVGLSRLLGGRLFGVILFNSGIILTMSYSVFQIKTPGEQKKLTYMFNIASLTQLFALIIVIIGFSIGASANDIANVGNDYSGMILFVVGILFVLLVVVTRLGTFILQKTASAPLSFGWFARWVLFILFITGQLAPIWVIGLPG